MTLYDCRCRHHRPPVTMVLPSQRLFEIDPEPDQPSMAQNYCAAWMAERDRQRQAQEKRRARV